MLLPLKFAQNLWNGTNWPRQGPFSRPRENRGKSIATRHDFRVFVRPEIAGAKLVYERSHTRAGSRIFRDWKSRNPRFPFRGNENFRRIWSDSAGIWSDSGESVSRFPESRNSDSGTWYSRFPESGIPDPEICNSRFQSLEIQILNLVFQIPRIWEPYPGESGTRFSRI